MPPKRPLHPAVKAEIGEAVAHFHQALPDSVGWEYLEGRKIGRGTARALRLGYVDPSNPREGWERFAGRLAIPYLNPKGDAVWIKFRATHITNPNAKGDVIKYAQQKGEEARLYNTIALTAKSDTLCLVEGEFDAIVLTALGIPAVGIPGAGAFKPHMAKALEGWPRTVLFYDNDPEGKNGKRPGEALLEAVKAKMPDVIPLVAPGGYNDIGDAYEAGLGEAIKALAYGYELERPTDERRTEEDAHEYDGTTGRPATAVEVSPATDVAPGEHPAEPAGDGQPFNRYDGISNPDSEPPL
jgi:DNA primase